MSEDKVYAIAEEFASADREFAPVCTPEGGFRVDSVILTLRMRAVAKTRRGVHLGNPEPVERLNAALRITLDL